MRQTAEFSTQIPFLIGTDLHVFSHRASLPARGPAAGLCPISVVGGNLLTPRLQVPPPTKPRSPKGNPRAPKGHTTRIPSAAAFEVPPKRVRALGPSISLLSHPALPRLRFPERISDILFAVRNSVLLTIFLFTVCAVALARPSALIPAAPLLSQTVSPVVQPRPQSAQPSPPQAQPPAASSQAPPAPPKAPVAAPAPSSFVIVLDPAHGGTDTGARGTDGIVEKDVVLQFARNVRADLERQGYRVVMTRNDDSNPSYDDRAAAANAYRDAIFISIHVSSTGTVGTARAYYYQFWTPVAPAAALAPTSGAAAPPSPEPQTAHSDLIVWRQAQRSYADSSRRLADGLQLQLDQLFQGSPAASTGVEMRDLRSVTAPAVAVELSSVAVSKPGDLYAMAAPLAASIVKAVGAYRTGPTAGAK